MRLVVSADRSASTVPPVIPRSVDAITAGTRDRLATLRNRSPAGAWVDDHSGYTSNNVLPVGSTSLRFDHAPHGAFERLLRCRSAVQQPGTSDADLAVHAGPSFPTYRETSIRRLRFTGRDQNAKAPGTRVLKMRVRRKGRAKAAFWRSAVWLLAEAARAADRPAGIGPADAPLPIGMEAALLMARLGAEGNACGGTPTKRASAVLAALRYRPIA